MAPYEHRHGNGAPLVLAPALAKRVQELAAKACIVLRAQAPHSIRDLCAIDCVGGVRNSLDLLENIQIITADDNAEALRSTESECDVSEKVGAVRVSRCCKAGARYVFRIVGDLKEGKLSLGVIRPCRKSEIDPRRPGLKVCLIARKSGKVIGRHHSKAHAARQERAIQARRHA